MGNKLSKTVDRYEESFSAQGRMNAIATSGPKIQEIEEKNFKADLTIKEAKVGYKAIKAEKIESDTLLAQAQAKLNKQIASNIIANLDKLAENAAQEAASSAVTGGKS